MIYWSILDSERQKVLPKLGFCRELGFYLAGGTALALQIGHRDSVDFDFFKLDPFDTKQLFDLLQQSFSGQEVVMVQDERDTLTVIVDAAIKLSFMSYPYPLLGSLVDAGPLDMADIPDIGCMKLSAIAGDAVMKDYVDLYFILQRIPLAELLRLCERKLPRLDRALILKSLVFFDDLVEEPILYTEAGRVDFAEVKQFLRDHTRTAY